MQENPDIAMDAIVHLAQHITLAKRNDLSRVLADLNTAQPRDLDSSPVSRRGSNPFASIDTTKWKMTKYNFFNFLPVGNCYLEFNSAHFWAIKQFGTPYIGSIIFLTGVAVIIVCSLYSIIPYKVIKPCSKALNISLDSARILSSTSRGTQCCRGVKWFVRRRCLSNLASLSSCDSCSLLVLS